MARGILDTDAEGEAPRGVRFAGDLSGVCVQDETRRQRSRAERPAVWGNATLYLNGRGVILALVLIEHLRGNDAQRRAGFFDGDAQMSAGCLGSRRAGIAHRHAQLVGAGRRGTPPQNPGRRVQRDARRQGARGDRPLRRGDSAAGCQLGEVVLTGLQPRQRSGGDGQRRRSGVHHDRQLGARHLSQRGAVGGGDREVSRAHRRARRRTHDLPGGALQRPRRKRPRGDRPGQFAEAHPCPAGRRHMAGRPSLWASWSCSPTGSWGFHGDRDRGTGALRRRRSSRDLHSESRAARCSRRAGDGARLHIQTQAGRQTARGNGPLCPRPLPPLLSR